jgi:DNA-binding beta-propeller fold protein YncE
LKYSQAGELLTTIGSSGTAPGQFQGPSDTAISPISGNFVVSDQFNNRVQILTPDGQPIRVIGGLGSGPSEFIQPISVKVDEADNIFVTDSVNSRIQVFDKDGTFLTQFGQPAGAPPQLGDPPYGNPLNLAPGVFNWTAGSDYKNGKLYVGDFFQGRVQILNVDRTPTPTSVPESSPLLGLIVLGAGAAWSQRRRKPTVAG